MYLLLSSVCCKGEFPENAGSEFTNKFPLPIDLSKYTYIQLKALYVKRNICPEIHLIFLEPLVQYPVQYANQYLPVIGIVQNQEYPTSSTLLVPLQFKGFQDRLKLRIVHTHNLTPCESISETDVVAVLNIIK